MEKTSDLLISYFNGEFVPDSQCVVHVTDRGFRYGDAVFDIERTFDGQLFSSQGAPGEAHAFPQIRSNGPGDLVGGMGRVDR